MRRERAERRQPVERGRVAARAASDVDRDAPSRHQHGVQPERANLVAGLVLLVDLGQPAGELGAGGVGAGGQQPGPVRIGVGLAPLQRAQGVGVVVAGAGELVKP